MLRPTGYTRHVISSTGSRHIVTSLPPVKATAAVSRGSDTVQLLMTKPLFWTSVISLCISVVATTVLVALCICRRHRPVPTHGHNPRRRLVHSTATSDNQLPAAAPHNGMISYTITDSAWRRQIDQGDNDQFHALSQLAINLSSGDIAETYVANANKEICPAQISQPILGPPT